MPKRLTRIRTTMPPTDCAVASWYPGADLVDSFAVTLPGPGPHDLARLDLARLDLARLARSGLSNPAPWITAALTLRDAAVRLFGIRT
ncbi:hypothetical protein [Methylobacterium platani]|uniref:hypothetical protein n=1 Tax=Methylobacterium platani TaxID=427683 RepID=UPI000ADAC0EF